jgi:hypothetical protein
MAYLPFNFTLQHKISGPTLTCHTSEVRVFLLLTTKIENGTKVHGLHAECNENLPNNSKLQRRQTHDYYRHGRHKTHLKRSGLI